MTVFAISTPTKYLCGRTKRLFISPVGWSHCSWPAPGWDLSVGSRQGRWWRRCSSCARVESPWRNCPLDSETWCYRLYAHTQTRIQEEGCQINSSPSQEKLITGTSWCRLDTINGDCWEGMQAGLKFQLKFWWQRYENKEIWIDNSVVDYTGTYRTWNTLLLQSYWSFRDKSNHSIMQHHLSCKLPTDKLGRLH